MDNPSLVGVAMRGAEVAKIKRFGRRFGPEIRDALMVEQRFRCSTPGCTNWLRLEIDHVHPYAKDGPTNYTNADGKCDTCHDEKTRQDRLDWNDTG
jgi:5-methylcytosine-specific restriction endonuclease McrA